MSVAMPLALGNSASVTLQQAHRSYVDAHSAAATRRAPLLERVRYYDIAGMNRAVNVCAWGRSGSFLLASYLDGHEDIVMLPMLGGMVIYPFFAEFASLSVWEKLVAYPAYAEEKVSVDTCFFLKGPVRIAPADYYAAVEGLFELYGERPTEWLNSRLRFVQFLHVAYAAAVRELPLGSPRPLILYAQHFTDDELAERFIEDFPDGRFIHTIRDPISSLGSWFDWGVRMRLHVAGIGLLDLDKYHLPVSIEITRDLLDWDRCHRGMEARTRAIRFEDLHLAPEATMRRLAEWLGVPYRSCLVDSTFNGNPYTYQSGGATWVGANPANAARRSGHLYFADRWLMFALLRENFRAWRYPSPRVFESRWISLCAVALLSLVPMKMEFLNAQRIVELQILPALRKRRYRLALGFPPFLVKRRLRTIALLAKQARARLTGDRRLLELL